MLCQNCQKRDASIHLKRIVNGETGEVHLCAACAAALGYVGLFAGVPFPFLPTLSYRGQSEAAARIPRCETCGLSLEDVAGTSALGCPDCYGAFREKLTPYLTKLHGRAVYRGEGLLNVKPPESNGKRWYENVDASAGAVLGSEVTFGVNAVHTPFPLRMNVAQKLRFADAIAGVLAQSGEALRRIDMGSLYPYEAVSLAERLIVTPEFASAGAGAVLLLSADKNLSVMLSDEDHIRIRCVSGGATPQNAFARAGALRDLLFGTGKLAFDKKLGFLSRNPMRLGTGMTASSILHLPALTGSGTLPAIASALRKMGFVLQGAFGDGLSAAGDLYRLSNTLTMGLSEKEAVANLEAVTRQLATRERAAAEKYVEDIGVRDRIRRSVALLSSAELLTSAELTGLLSWVRLGALYGLCDFDLAVLGELAVNLFPAGVNTLAGQKIPSVQRDALRAKLVRAKLFGEKNE